MTNDTGDPVSDVVTAREKIELLEQSLSEMFHVFYGVLTWILTFTPPELEKRVAAVIRCKILQMPQGYPLGQRLVELDEQNGGLLESKGVLLSRWVYEPREKQRW